MEVKIDKDIPIPGRGGHLKKYPLGELGVGESFFLDCQGGSAEQKRAQIAPAIARAQKDGKRFTTRKFDGGLRIWRTD